MAQQRTLTLTLSEDEYQLLVAEHQALGTSFHRWFPDGEQFVMNPENVAELLLVEQLRENAARRAVVAVAA